MVKPDVALFWNSQDKPTTEETTSESGLTRTGKQIAAALSQQMQSMHRPA
jgi:hypothetical protein